MAIDQKCLTSTSATLSQSSLILARVDTNKKSRICSIFNIVFVLFYSLGYEGGDIAAYIHSF